MQSTVNVTRADALDRRAVITTTTRRLSTLTMKRNILKVIALVGVISAALAVLTDRGQAQQGNQAPQAVTILGGPNANPFRSPKNVKVLTDVPEGQLLQVMEFFGASLGRRCNFCHVNNNGQLDYAADTKPEKNTAREMIKMVLDLHKQKFAGSTDISCYTCHRGRTSPADFPQLPLPDPPPSRPGPFPPQGPAPSATPGQSPAGPTADQVFEKYLNAIGGQAALDKSKTRMIKATRGLPNLPGIIGITLEVYRSGADKFYTSFNTPQGTIERGFTGGTAGWERNASGVHDLTDGLPFQDPFDVLWLDLARYKELYPRIGGQVRQDKIDGHDVYVISASNLDGRRVQLFFDAETGLLRRITRFITTMIGVIPAQTDLDDYRDVDGVKVAFSITTALLDVGNPRSTMKLIEIKFSPIDDSQFRRPAAPKPDRP